MHSVPYLQETDVLERIWSSTSCLKKGLQLDSVDIWWGDSVRKPTVSSQLIHITDVAYFSVCCTVTDMFVIMQGTYACLEFSF